MQVFKRRINVGEAKPDYEIEDCAKSD